MEIKDGFTLVELLVVLSIIAILAAISIHYYYDIKSSAIETSMLQDVRNCRAKIEAWYAKNGDYLSFDQRDCNVSQGNTLSVSLTDSTYLIRVSNQKARAGRKSCSIDHTGQVIWQ